MILKNSKELLEHLKSPTFNHVSSIKSFDFSTLYNYTTIPHQKLKNRLTSIIRNTFICHKAVTVHTKSPRNIFLKEHSDFKNRDDLIKMFEFLVNNIFVVFA